MVRAWIVAMALVAGCSGRSLVEVGDATSDDDGEADADADADVDEGADGQPPPPPVESSSGDESTPPDEPLPGPDAPYPYCEFNGGDYKPFCPPTVDAHGFSNWHVDGDAARFCEGGDDCNACICMASCRDPEGGEDDVSFCPVPTSGTAQPECIEAWTACYLMCDQGESCPDDMTCVLEPELQRRVCAWLRV